MKNKRVLFIGSYYPIVGGAEKYLYEVGKYHGKKNSIILCPDMEGECPKEPCIIERAFTLIKKPESIKRFDKLEYIKNYSFMIPAIIKGGKIIKKDKVDIINPQFGLSFGIIGNSLKKKHKKPMVLTLHGGGFNFNGWKKILKLSVKRVLLNADKIIAVSNAILNEAKELAEIEGEVIYNSVDLNKYKNVSDEEYILFVGRLAKMKGLGVLISAAKDLPQYKFIIVGDGPERRNLEEQVKKDNLTNVIFTGQKSQEETREFISKCSLLAVPSLFGEGLPFSLVEAMACGKPVIGTKVRGIPEVINKNGVLINPNNIRELNVAIKKIMEDKKIRKNMGKESRRFAEQNFDFTKSMERLNKIYEEVSDRK